MKRITQIFSFLSLLLLWTGNAKAEVQPVTDASTLKNGDVIYLYSPCTDFEASGKHYFCTSTSMKTSTLDAVNYYMMEFVSVSNDASQHFRLRRYVDNMYVPKAIEGESVIGNMVSQAEEAAVFTFAAASSNLPADEKYDTDWKDKMFRLATTYTSGTGEEKIVYLNANDVNEMPQYSAETGSWSVWGVYAASVSAVKLTYNLKDEDGKDLGSPYTQYVSGGSYPQLPASMIKDFCSYTYPSGNIPTNVSEVTKDVTVHYGYPFKVSGDETPTYWYFLEIGNPNDMSAGYGIVHAAQRYAFIQLDKSRTDFSKEDRRDLWCFTGDPYNGFKLVNGIGDKTLAGPLSSSIDGGKYSYPIPYDESDIQSDWTNLWEVTKSTAVNGVTGFYLNPKGVSTNKMSIREIEDMASGNKTYRLAYWTDGTGVSSTFSVSNALKNELTLNDGGDGYAYSTLYMPYAVMVDDATEVYYGKENGDCVNMELIKEGSHFVPANTGVLLRKEASSAATTALTLANSTAEDPEVSEDVNLFRGVTKDSVYTVKEKLYVFSKGSKGLGFYHPSTVGGQQLLKANKAFIDKENAAQALRLSFNNEAATGIADIAGEMDEAGMNAPVYDLSGRRVATPVKGGIYIRGGKKVFVK